jgi:hypothetical protein
LRRLLANGLLLLVSLLLSLVAAEAVARFDDDLPLFALPLPLPVGADTAAAHLDEIPRAPGVARDWFFSDPPPLPNRRKPPADWVRLKDEIERTAPADLTFQAADMFKAWNSAFAGDPCKHRFLRYAPGQLFVYDPPDGRPTPPYRFLPDATTPLGLVTNQFGWRGAPIEFPRRENLVRIVFVGASTTVGGHHLPFSYPELVGHWLNVWAKAKHPAVSVEVVNAGRESTVSTDFAAEVRTEIMPLRPDLVVYYEGANQFRLDSVVEKMPQDAAGGPARRPAVNVAPAWLRSASRYLALARRIQAAAGFIGSDIDGHEWPKPDYRVVWPAGLDEHDPDLAYPHLPITLNVILHDLEQIRGNLATVGGELALSSFVWLVKDSMVLDPIRNRNLLEYLNVLNYPFRYRDIERLAAFQNRVYAKYAAEHGLAFIDVAKVMPFDPDLFVDAIHTTYAGERLRAWVVLQQLIPTIERHLADGSWPKPPPKPSEVLPPPTYQPRRITFTCGR